MPKVELFDNSMKLLQKVMDLRVQNQQVIASNVANADTPGYRPVHLAFEENLREAANTPSQGQTSAITHSAHFPIGGGAEIDKVQATVIQEQKSSVYGDGNTVDINSEMILLSENQILYEAATQMLNKKLGLLKYVAQETR